MNLGLLATALAVVGGSLLAVSVKDARWAVVGVAISLGATPYIADPLPSAPSLAARVVSVVLGTYVMWVMLRAANSSTRGSVLSWPVNLLAAAGAFLVGYGAPGLGGPAVGPAEAQGAAFALAALAVGPVVFGRDAFRLGVGLVLLVTAAELSRVGLAGEPSPIEQLVIGGLTVGLLGGWAALCANAFAASGDFEMADRRRPHGELQLRDRADHSPGRGATDPAKG